MPQGCARSVRPPPPFRKAATPLVLLMYGRLTNCKSHPSPSITQVTTSVWRLYAAQHLAANQAMVALLSTPAQPAAAAAKPAACTAAAAACTACPPCSPASVLHAARTPSRGVSKESVARRLVALIRSPSVASSAGSAADSLASHPLDAADAADADAAAANDAAEPARRVRSPGRRAALAAALVPLVVAALAGRRNAGASQPRRAGPPTKRR